MTAWTPERIAQEQIALAALEFIFEADTHPLAMAMLRAPGEPATILAHVAVSIMNDAVRKHEYQVPETAIVGAALEITNELSKLVKAAAIFEFDDSAEGMRLLGQQVIEQLIHGRSLQ